MKKPVIKIFGERNTGTNYLSRLVERNLSVSLLPGTVPRRFCITESMRDAYIFVTRRRNLGWKHGMPMDYALLEKYGRRLSGGRLIFLTLSKNPYAWLLSLYRRPYNSLKKHQSFIDFLHRPWPPLKRDNYNGPFINPVDMWNKKNAAYLDLNRHFPCANLRYEDLLKDPEREIRAVAGICRVPMQRFHNITQSTKEKDKNYDFYRQYYLEQKWKTQLDRTSIEFINRYADRGLMRRFNYRIL